MKVAELEGAKLDYWVAKATGMLRMMPGSIEEQLGGYHPSINWSQGGPIIEREWIELRRDAIVAAWHSYCWAKKEDVVTVSYSDGNTALIAAMRAYVASKFGEEVGE